MKRLLTFVVLTAALVFTSSAGADADSATHYYLSLGDSLASGPERGGDGNDYPEQLFAMLSGARCSTRCGLSNRAACLSGRVARARRNRQQIPDRRPTHGGRGC
jgi:hypothetical protein